MQSKELLSQLLNDIGIALWVWDLQENTVNYNQAFLKVVGYDEEPLDGDLSSWEKLVHPDDCSYSLEQLALFRDGKISSYNIKCRLVKKDSSVIWVMDQGNFTKYDEQGNPTQISGVIRDITQEIDLEKRLQEKKQKQKLSMKFADFTVWEWDIENNQVIYEPDYIESLGYKGSMFEGDSTIWSKIVHPDDFNKMSSEIQEYVSGSSSTYNCKLRIKNANGEYIWVRDIGEITKYDNYNNPLQMVGGRININEFELTTQKLELYQNDLEEQIKERNTALIRQDSVLLDLNRNAQFLMGLPTGYDFEEIAYQQLKTFSSLEECENILIFRNKTVDGKPYCYLASKQNHNFRHDFSFAEVALAFKDVSITYASNGKFNETTREDFYQHILDTINNVSFDNIDYQKILPTFYNHILSNQVLNMPTTKLRPSEFIFSKLQGIKTILVSPIILDGDAWGFVMLESRKKNNYQKEDEKLIALVGHVFAQAIHKNELELDAKETIEYNQILFNATPICCNLWLDGVNVRTNEESARMFNLSGPAEYLEKFYSLSPEFQPCGVSSNELIPDYLKIAEEKGYIKFEWMHCTIDGEPVPSEVELVKIPYRDRFVIAGYTHDMREFKQLMSNIEKTQAELRIAHEDALLSSKAKSNFLANISHEIRTPMNAISGMTDIILRESTDSEVSEYAINIKRACDSLLTIINSVLDISKIESGKLEIVESEYSLSETLHDVLNIASNRLELKKLMFITNFQHDIPEKIIGDEVRVKQIMVNILNNAIKFTHSGHIIFDVSGKFDNGELDLTFSVTDTGIGISKDDVEKLFVEFERVNTTKNRNIEGTGLGLAISKRLCEMMGGTIKVDSKLGDGTTFSINIKQKYTDYTPIAKVEQVKSVLIFESRDLCRNSMKTACDQLGLVDVLSCGLQSELNEALTRQNFDYIFTSSMYLFKIQEMLLKHNFTSKIILLADNSDIKTKHDYTTIMLPANTISIANALNGKFLTNDKHEIFSQFVAPDCKVLIVDDNLVNLKVAQGLLKPYEFQTFTAENGRAALEKIEKNEYDLVFMDHMMPVMDGIDATIAVRKLEGDYYKNLPIIALTANAIVGTKEMFIKEGMNDFLAKPIKLKALNDILTKWLPKDKQIFTTDDNSIISISELEEFSQVAIANIDIDLGVKRVGGDYNAYLDILHMYYKDGVKRIPSIRDFYDTKKLHEYKIEVHALKSASASIGALDISEKARMLEDAASKENWVYLNQSTIEFLDDFNILLENIREALKGVINDSDNSSNEIGDLYFYKENILKLRTALENLDINLCDNILEELFKYNWPDNIHINLVQIKDFVSGYEYDEAIEFIDTIVD